MIHKKKRAAVVVKKIHLEFMVDENVEKDSTFEELMVIDHQKLICCV
jgi:hypothetical protein